VIANIPKVTVLLATFNGEKFLEEQLTSLFDQQDVDIEVMANDDGSTDGTLKVLQRWKNSGLIVSISHSNRIGASGAFLTLLQKCEEKQYVAFCDQDDIWKPRKLISQVESLDGDYPQLVFSRRFYIDEQNKAFGISPSISKEISFGNALIENIAHGNTQLLNASAVRVVNTSAVIDIGNYDSWTNLLINAVGKCKIIDEPLVLYRVHKNNAVGLRKFNILRILNSVDLYYRQACEYKKFTEKLNTKSKLEEVEELISIIEEERIYRRIILALKSSYYRQSNIDHLIFQLILIFKKHKQRKC
jgi:glycosyltransferase involved in cell wall biosynthesis